MTSLFAKITEQMIANCKMHIIGEHSVDALWESDPQGNKKQKTNMTLSVELFIIFVSKNGRIR